MKNIREEVIVNPDAARIMEGLRDTGYDFNTALADIVDNSIAANANRIDVRVNINPQNQVTVYVADNGEGMDRDGLINAMKYGSSERKDPSSLGKFGLGLKTASTAFCKKLSVLSKTKNSEYNKVCWDLDYIAKINEWQLQFLEVNQDEVELLERTSEGESGTLVIWENVDRLMKTYSNNRMYQKAFQRIVESLYSHFAMVYQRFIDNYYAKGNVITITVNDKEVKPWDPFCRNEKREILSELDQQVEMPNGEKRKFHIAAFLLPRVEDWSSPDAHKEARISNDNEGFYIYRENRLIHHGDWLGIFTSDPHISLLRVEFSFDHTLDELFNVDIKKSRIILNEDIYDYLKNNFLPAPRKRANDLYRSTQASKATTKNEDKHQKANTIIDNNAQSMIRSDVQVIDADNNTVKITNAHGSSIGKLKIIEIDKKNNHRVIAQQKEDDTFLWEPCLANGEHAVYINTLHTFYTKVYSKIDDTDVVAAIDYLLWSLAEAELSTWAEEDKEQYQDMRYQTSKTLTKLLESLPDLDLEDEE